jgi:hypothetical protein
MAPKGLPIELDEDNPRTLFGAVVVDDRAAGPVEIERVSLPA